jgi:hypothetical protein
MPAPYLKHGGSLEIVDEDICLFAQTHYRNQLRRFGIKLDDRRRHMYIVGKTGMGKSTLMENMMLHDIYKGHGVGLVDPHGDFAEKIIDFIPASRINDVVYFNPGDINFPVGFNIFEVKNEEQKHLVAAGLMGVFKKIWPDVWSARMEYILNNTILALLEYPGSTLLGINRLLSDKKYRNRVVRQVKDPVIKSFWQVEFASYNERYAQEAVAAIQNKIGQFLSTNVIRNMVAQVKSTFDIRKMMDEKKIIIMNLSKGRIGEDNSRLLGGMLITKIQLSAMERVDTPEKDRQDFFLYVDEFQNFATPSFANILSEARKYRLSLIMAHQYILQLDEIVANAVFGNVGTIVSFRVGGADSEVLAKEFAPVFLEEDIVNLAKFNILLKLMIDGVASQPFSAFSLGPLADRTGSSEKVIRVSRERYAKTRESIEEKVVRWSGMEDNDEEEEDEEDGEENSTPAPVAAPQRRPVPTSAPRRTESSAPKRTESSMPKRFEPSKSPAKLTNLPSRDNFTRRNDERKSLAIQPKSEPVVSVEPQMAPEVNISFDAPSVQSVSSFQIPDPQAEEKLVVIPPVVSFESPGEDVVPQKIEQKISFSSAPVQQFENSAVVLEDSSGPKKKRRRRRKKKNGASGSENGGEIQANVQNVPVAPVTLKFDDDDSNPLEQY